MDCLPLPDMPGYEVLEAWIQTADLPNYDVDSNQGKESIAVARKTTSATSVRRRAYRWLKRRVRPSLKYWLLDPGFFIRTIKSIAKSNQFAHS